jgi:hypothetical protein
MATSPEDAGLALDEHGHLCLVKVNEAGNPDTQARVGNDAL